MRPPRESEFTGFIEERREEFLVGAVGPKLEDGHQYIGPAARVYVNDEWLHIVTDDYEGNAMLNIEALPFLIEALQRIKAKISPEEESNGSSPINPLVLKGVGIP